jgi:shikimate kinase
MPPFLLFKNQLWMSRVNNIYLIGPMGVGKTTIGRQLAKALQRPFYDSDKFIEQKTGVDIATIFEFEGEQGFRKREHKVIQELTQIQNIILATGGGVVVNEDNRRLLKQLGFVIYLQCSVERLYERTRKDTQRPLLQTENPRQRIEQLLKQREPLYSSCADLTINTENLMSKVVVKKILAKYRSMVD